MLKLRNILIIIGIFFLLKYLGQILKTKRAIKSQKEEEMEREKIRKQKEFVRANSGKTFVVPKNSENRIGEVEDVDYEEVKSK